jgi:hypothetical protein
MATPPHKTDTKVVVPGRPPASRPADDLPEAVNELTKAEQEAGKLTLRTFDQRLKAEQDVGEKLVAQAAAIDRAKRPRALKELPAPKSNPLHGHSRE